MLSGPPQHMRRGLGWLEFRTDSVKRNGQAGHVRTNQEIWNVCVHSKLLTLCLQWFTTAFHTMSDCNRYVETLTTFFQNQIWNICEITVNLHGNHLILKLKDTSRVREGARYSNVCPYWRLRIWPMVNNNEQPSGPIKPLKLLQGNW